MIFYTMLITQRKWFIIIKISIAKINPKSEYNTRILSPYFPCGISLVDGALIVKAELILLMLLSS